ncbi:CoA transferase [Amycolatopsis sp. K13G38]|uniref:CoA transferase n=1 Tax=Amycolatopsis acididurans TaxID=2724524 RepID=A0ABX1J6V6_9PSEU|nr:CaiB/BaiF CoA-transferase family protein [Amycolatopsis acididurans]NKQ55548.1 CoA transferase [Amycolatopsis acididurans]
MAEKPLAGIRVLEIGGYISLPYATALLCGLGAEVVKVEKPGVGEDFRRQMDDRSPYFVQFNTGKRSLAVDLKNPDGVEFVKSLVPHFDVVLENLRPGKIIALGLGPDVCRALKPDLVYGSVSGFGSGGPLEQRPAYDSIGQAYGGLYSLLSDAGSYQLAGGASADLVTALCTVTGVLAALCGKASSGRGSHVETSMMESISALTIDAITLYCDSGVNPSRQSRHPQGQVFCLKTSSGDYLAVHLSSSQKFFEALCDAIGRPDVAADPRFAAYNARQEHYFQFAGILETEFAKKPATYWEAQLTEHDVPFAPVLSISEYLDHPQTEWLDLLTRDRDDVVLVRPPWKFDGERPDRAIDAPRVGGDTREIAAEVLDGDRIEHLVQAGVLYSDK